MRLITTATLLLFVLVTYGQERDTTNLPVEEPKMSRDTISDPDDEAPRIIYYQTIPEENHTQTRISRKGGRNDIKTLSGNMSHSGGFGALSFRSTSFRNETMVLAGIRGGWIINRTLGIGIEGHGIIPTAKYSGIDPDPNDAFDPGDVVALGGYGGMFLELIFFSNEVIHVTFPVSGGAGWMGYHTDYDQGNLTISGSQLIDDDIFWYVEPGADIEINLSRSFRLAMGVSKRFTQDLELANTNTDAFSKMNYFVTLKVGGF